MTKIAHSLFFFWVLWRLRFIKSKNSEIQFFIANFVS
jgi:hypothetical protein